MTDEEIADLRARIERVLKLLDDPHDGLFTWTGMLNAAWWGVVEWCTPDVIIQNLAELDRAKYLFKTTPLERPTAVDQAVNLLQEYSGKLWRDGQHERSIAIADVIKGLWESTNESN